MGLLKERNSTLLRKSAAKNLQETEFKHLKIHANKPVNSGDATQGKGHGKTGKYTNKYGTKHQWSKQILNHHSSLRLFGHPYRQATFRAKRYTATTEV